MRPLLMDAIVWPVSNRPKYPDPENERERACNEREAAMRGRLQNEREAAMRGRLQNERETAVREFAMTGRLQ